MFLFYLIIFPILYFIMGILDLEFFKWYLPAREFKMLSHVAVAIESKKERHTAHGSSWGRGSKKP